MDKYNQKMLTDCPTEHHNVFLNLRPYGCIIVWITWTSNWRNWLIME